MSVLAAVDVGGTKVRVEVFAEGSAWEDGPLGIRVLDTPRSGDVISPVARAVREAAGDEEVLAVGIGCPGPLDPMGGVVLNPPNLSKEWWGLEAPRLLSGRLGCPAAIENDCNLAALGEAASGGGRGYASTLYITVSTGVGGGLVVDGEIFGGARGFAVEVGHMKISDKDYPCGCGRTGCVESAVSGTAISRRAREAGWTPPGGTPPGGTPDGASPTSLAVATAAADGDEIAHRILSEAASHFGRAIVDLIYCYDPAVVLIGGGVAGSDLFMRLTREAVDAEAMMPAFRGVPVLRASLGGRSVIRGALVLARRTLDEARK